ncbi:EamA family transporter [Microbacterium terricola]|uniref:Multidrug transporter n=1 Tax=Microbacterium terricola TaxID=344163 RepID=A0ABM8E0N1_9MICO|nr:EamA family transporter [Microbacterium terricola]UYK40898.1 EamA family transporter [Microbacterium terricola]BDV31352.1 multidrug transporter [Microbacterium terricola]
MLPAVLAFAGAVVYGAADFLGGLAAKQLRSIVATCVAAAAGFVALLAAYPFIGGAWSAADVGWGVLSGFFGVAAIALLYACLALGPMSILSPLTAVVSAIAPMLWGLIVNGERLAPIGWAGLAVALLAVVLVGFIPGAAVVRPSLRGITMAVGSGLAIGGFLIVMDFTSDESGVLPLVVNRATNTLITLVIVGVLILAAVRRSRPIVSALQPQGTSIGATPTGHADVEHATAPITVTAGRIPAAAWWLAVSCGLVDAVANALTLIALRLGDLSIVSALTAMYPIGTILLAAVVLRERIAGVQWAGLALALAAGGMLALA